MVYFQPNELREGHGEVNVHIVFLSILLNCHRHAIAFWYKKGPVLLDCIMSANNIKYYAIWVLTTLFFMIFLYKLCIILKLCPKRAPDVPEMCPRVPEVCPRCVLCPKCAPGVPQMCPKCAPGVPQVCPGCAPGVHRQITELPIF